MLGDIQIAEPGATIGFAGRRVIEQTVHETLPEGFQSAEFLHEHGMIDCITPRAELRETLSRIIGLLRRPRPDDVAAAALPAPHIPASDDGEASDGANQIIG